MRELKKSKENQLLLSKTFLFRGVETKLSQKAYRSLCCSCVEFEPGEQIYSRTNFIKSIGIVISGMLKAVKGPYDGRGIVLNTFKSGGVFGVAGLFYPCDRYVSEVVAACRSQVMFLSQDLLRELFYQEPKIAENYITFLSGRIRYLNTCIDHFTGGSAQAKLAQFLLTLGEERQGPFVLPCPMTQLSNTLDIGRASLYRAFDSLTQEGLIRREGRKVEILNLDALKLVRF